MGFRVTPPPPPQSNFLPAISIAYLVWKAPQCKDPHSTWYVDVARSESGLVGCRIQLLPSRIRSQQSAELAAIGMALWLGAHMGLSAIHIAADNLSAIFLAISLTGGGGGGMGNPPGGRPLRRLAHTLRWIKI